MCKKYTLIMCKTYTKFVFVFYEQFFVKSLFINKFSCGNLVTN